MIWDASGKRKLDMFRGGGLVGDDSVTAGPLTEDNELREHALWLRGAPEGDDLGNG